MKLTRHSPAAFSLVEVTIALGVIAISLVPVFGLLSVGFNSNQAAIEQTAAASLASALASDLKQTPAAAPGATTNPLSPRFLIQVPVKLENTPPPAHTLFLTEDGTVADSNAASSPPASAEDNDASPALAPRYRATFVFTPSTIATDKSATAVRILITWPALADPKGKTLPARYSGSFETMISLDRN